MKDASTLHCAARGCRVNDPAQLYRIGYCGGFGVGQGAKVVKQRKKGASGECKALSASAGGYFNRGDMLCPLHLQQLKEVYMFTAHPVKKASAAEKKALVAMGLPSTRYCIGVAPTSKGLCRECRDAIEEGSLRFGIEHRFGAHYEARWRHWECTKVCDFQNALSLAQGGWSKVPGFNDISAAEQKVVLSTKLPGKSTAPAKFRQLKKRPAKACRNNELTASCGTSSKFRRLAKKPAGTRDPVIDLA
eukprot:gnl/TRDRNA2_/TRDRNA2_164076_c0_seq3.p1 gnl/TRDRNA2_/TRDRNA2_164076_c0~~gnl/TRDRNA2_/TRDRNA2_164076_c0_seq3.p1  ORF type:complete len:247 (-),score=34.63 gnl/TRDRNA2_/TRDRNA2_164076_c0_seq3:340-1080(-)